MSTALSLHLALHLVPYLDPSDIVCARRVCKTWCEIFSSKTLAQVALRVHFPLCRGIHSSSQPRDYSTFNRISKCYAALKSGVPRQELRVPITKTRRNTYIWTFSENLLVLQSSHHPRAVLTLIYLDARTESRRIINGEIVLGVGGETVIRVKVCRNVLVVERTSNRESAPLEFLCTVDCFRLSLSPENDEVIAEKVSSFDTFGFDYVDFSHKTISDHSGKYYAVYSRAGAFHSGGALQVWDIETGKMVRRIPESEFPKILSVTNVLVIAKQGPGGPQQVVVTGNDRAKNSRARWSQLPGEWGYMADFKVFPIEAGSPEWTGRVENQKKQHGRFSSPPRESPLLASSFKVPRFPAGMTLPDTPDTPGYLGEEVGLTLWNLKRGGVCSFYHRIVPDEPPDGEPDAPLAVEREFRMACKGERYWSPFSVGSRSGISLTMDFTGRNEDFEGTRLMLSQLRVRGFYPSATPGVVELDWETCLKSPKNSREARGLYSVNRNVSNFNMFPVLETDENEFASAFLELRLGGVDLVLVLWGDGFHGKLPLGGKVLN